MHTLEIAAVGLTPTDWERIVQSARRAGVAVRGGIVEADQIGREGAAGRPEAVVVSSRLLSDHGRGILAHVERITPPPLLVAWLDADAHTPGWALQFGADLAISRREPELAHVIHWAVRAAAARHAAHDARFALTAASKALEALIDSVPDPVVYVHDGIVVRANAAFAALVSSDAAPDAFEGELLLDLLEDHDPGLAERAKEVLTAKPPARAEVMVADGRRLALCSADSVYRGERCLQLILREVGAGVSDAGDRPLGTRKDALQVMRLYGVSAGGGEPAASVARIVWEPPASAHPRQQARWQHMVCDAVRAAGWPEPLPDVFADGRSAVLVVSGDVHREQVAERLRSTIEALASWRLVTEQEDKTLRARGALCIIRGGGDAEAYVAALDAAVSDAQPGTLAVVSDESIADGSVFNNLAREVELALEEKRLRLCFHAIASLRVGGPDLYDVYLRVRGRDGRGSLDTEEVVKAAAAAGLAGRLDLAVLGLLGERLSSHQGRARFFVRVSEASVTEEAFLTRMAARFAAMTEAQRDMVVFDLPVHLAASSAGTDFLALLRDYGLGLCLSQCGEENAASVEALAPAFVRIDADLAVRALQDDKERERLGALLRRVSERTDAHTILPHVYDQEALAMLFQLPVDYVTGWGIARVQEEPRPAVLGEEVMIEA